MKLRRLIYRRNLDFEEKMIELTKDKIVIPPKVASIHDISGYGRCANTVIIPTLSALGVQCVPLPTAFLSTHTGGFDGFTFLDLTDEMKKVISHWNELSICFDGVYSGFLASAEQIHIVLDYALECKRNNPDCIFLADPVMGDDGEKYKTYTDEMCILTKELIKHADVITPNFTEACILTDEEYCEYPDEDKQLTVITKLKQITDARVVITGLIDKTNGKVSSIMFDENGTFKRITCDYVDVNYPGTGDLFSSVVLSLLLENRTLTDAVTIAGEFISLAASYTKSCGTPTREGLCFEGILHKLYSMSRK